ncbi:NAD(P)H-hydrate dehydratase [Robbsia sp. Bb-Pol-6]|uniref:Multifunctional fusion protein n=1 Tax=Robbsia betulipollinis TaxID=2981849 RepID=A0ABT3ZNL8_9BURK|nr:NAD(P)H-hydrate dehydratase [Robbsia betulipollinis]MCY0388129.1 NAD(P)H-hydrate dehydratase [Robbsia betulipollinis]
MSSLRPSGTARLVADAEPADIAPDAIAVIDTHDRALSLERTALLRALEAASAATVGPHALMLRAGEATAAWLLAQLSPAAAPGPSIWLFAGPGNNGGDALCAAASLRRQGADARVCLPSEPTGPVGRWALERARAAGVPLQTLAPTPAQCAAAAWLVDGLFGIGLSRALGEPFASLARTLSARTAAGARVLALDIPSGLDADTGTIVGGELAVEVSHTLTFLAAKPGLFTGVGRDLAGHVALARLGVDDARIATLRHATAADGGVHHAAGDSTASDAAPTARHEAEPEGLPPRDEDETGHPAALPAALALNAPDGFAAAFPRRKASSNKGTFGSVAIIGGDTGTCGAAILSARAALYCGAGRVHAALIGQGGPAYDPPHPEIMMRQVDAIALDTMDGLTIGPGLGKSAHAAQVLRDVLALALPTIIDADALNLIAADPDLAARVRAQGRHLVLTPHPGEAARLLGVTTRDIEADRIDAITRLVRTYACTVVLKGSGTLIAAPDGRFAINPTGNSGLATGGTGDVLSGVIGAFLAQHLAPFDAALAATWIHGRAAEELAIAGVGPAGLTAGELAPAMRALLNRLLARRAGTSTMPETQAEE